MIRAFAIPFRYPIILCVIYVFAGSSKCLAWNQSGHHIINLIAYSLLSDECKEECVKLLRGHPRFDRHFLGAMPQQVWSAEHDVKELWIFAHAGQWPDLVRSSSSIVSYDEKARYSRPPWHFCDGPLFLREVDQVELTIDDPILAFEQGEEKEVKNAVHAIKYMRARLADKTLPTEDRSVALCWLTHLIADLHQPCHAAALFSQSIYPEGDSGASAIPIQARGRIQNLHALWDNALLGETDFATVCAKSDRMSVQARANWEAEKMDFQSERLFRESYKLAITHVYTQNVRTQIERWEDDEAIGELKVEWSYRTTMRKVATERAVLAARRLASVIESAVKASRE